MNKLSHRISILVIIAISLIIASLCAAHERTDGGYFNIMDETGNVVYVTARSVETGDQFLTENNKRYEVISIDGDTAHAKFLGQTNMSQYLPEVYTNWFAFNNILNPSVANAQSTGKVAIYHTHSDESYVPTDGKESILGAGGIYKVGEAFKQALNNKGLEVIFSQAKHDPHDNMAYERSRRTVADLLKQKPDCIFDVHRDAVPAEVYKGNVDGQDVTKVQLVVGKFGPTGKQIEDYALQIKAAADKQHPGLVKGIFFAKGGDYNQDLHPRSMLLEVGSHTNNRESAEKGIALFADVVPTILGRTSAAPGATTGQAGVGTQSTGPSGASKSIGWIIGLVIVGAAAFLLLSTGSLKEAGAKLKQFTTTEFANFFGPKINKKKIKDKDEENN